MTQMAQIAKRADLNKEKICAHQRNQRHLRSI
jgi:hypothetical protein